MNFFEEDGMMFNVVGKKNKEQTEIKKTKSKMEEKKQRYSRKLILERSKQRASGMLSQNIEGQKILDKTSKSRLKTHQSLVWQAEQEGEQTVSYKKNSEAKKQYRQKIIKNNNRRHEYKQKSNQIVGKVEIPVKFQRPQQMMAKISHQNQNLDVNPLSQFNLHPLLISSLERNNIQKMTDIQKMSYHKLFAHQNCIIKANTGSGKTLAYLIPLINELVTSNRIPGREIGTVVLVICPSRQLCLQAEKQALRCLKRLPFIIPGCLLGGEQVNHQKNRLRKGTTILFATPGRLLYHLQNTTSFRLQNIRTILFQQADRTLDMGFQQSVTQIIEILKGKVVFSHLHKVLVSAHFNEKVHGLIDNLEMGDPHYIGFQKKHEDHQDQKQINISENLQQKYVLVSEEERIPLMIAYINLLRKQKILIFVSTIDEVVYLDMMFNNLFYRDSNGFKTEQKVQERTIFKLHGDLDQKLRTQTYFNFRKSSSAILISTEVASRGLDFPDLSHIILFDPPPTITDYGNRVGRSGRFNSTGVSLMILHYQESDFVQKIRYYDPKIEQIKRDVITKGYTHLLKVMNIGDDAIHYLEGLVRGLVKDDEQKYQVARNAYTSMLRAYARLPDKNIFMVKKLNLKLLARTFGLNSVKQTPRIGNKSKERQTNFQTIKKRRKVEDVKFLQFSEYM